MGSLDNRGPLSVSWRPWGWSLRARLLIFSLVLSLSPALVLTYVNNLRVQSALLNQSDTMAGVVTLSLVLSMLVAGILSVALAITTANPISRLVKDVEQLALGDLERTSYEKAQAAKGQGALNGVDPQVTHFGSEFGRIDEHVFSQRKQLASRFASNETIVAAAAGLNPNRSALQQQLDDYWKSDPTFTGVFVLDATGLCFAAANQKPGKNYSFRPYFKEAMQGNSYASDISLSIDTRSPQIVYSAPIRYRGQIVGVLALRSDGSAEYPPVDGRAVLSSSLDEVERLKQAVVRMREYLLQLSMVVDRVAAGDLSQETPPRTRRDILGIACQGMTRRLRDLVGEVKITAESLGGTASQLESAASQTGVAVHQVSAAMESMASGSQEVTRSAQMTRGAVDQLLRAIDTIASGANKQSRQVQAGAAAAAQMAARVEQVTDSVGSLSASSEKTHGSASHGAIAVQETVASMEEIKTVVLQAVERVEELGKLGDRIGAVVETIDDIAEQTNLLALNAAIEAARAGEHGRGFAVVADEVRKLAERSRRETKAITELIKEIQGGTKQAVAAMETGSTKVRDGSTKAGQTKEALQQILEAVKSMVFQVNKIASAAREMGGSSRSVVEAMESISAVVEENTVSTREMNQHASMVSTSTESVAAVAEEYNASTEEVSASTQEMTAQIEGMGVDVHELATSADRLRTLVARFKLGTDDITTSKPVERAQPLAAKQRVLPLSRKAAQ